MGQDRNHRGFERLDDTLLVSYSIAEEFAPEFTQAYDIGLGGMAMITNAHLPQDKPIIVQLELRADERPMIRLAGIVRWSNPEPQGTHHRTGVAFVDVDRRAQTDLQRYIDTLRLLQNTDVV